jgi:rhodanese-related sulfurtransferase
MTTRAPRFDQAQRRALLALPVAFGALLLFRQWRMALPEVPQVDVAEARSMIDAGAVVVDVRERVPYAARHLVGAVSAPVSELAQAIPAALAALRNSPILVYCGDGMGTGPKGTQLLRQAGFPLAVNLRGGIEAWADARLPLSYGAQA